METTVSYKILNNSIKNESDQIPWTFNEKVMIIISYSSSISLSSIGNVLVIIVFWVGSCRPNRNNEVRQFLTNLAVSDLLISLFCVPFTFTYILLWDWPFPHVFCPIVLSIQLLAVTASSITNMVIGLDRFWVVIYPMKSRITRKRSKLVIGCIWVSSILFSSVQCFVGRAYLTNGGYTECSEKWDNHYLQVSYTISILLITYILPLFVLTVTYTIVGVKLWRRSLPGEADEMRDAKHMKSKIKVIKMLSIIVICFGLCWLPLHLFFVVTHVSQSQGFTKNLNIAYVICHWIAMSNSFVNPVVYSFMNDSFKSDFQWLVYQKCCGICQRHSWSRKDNFNTTSARNSVSNNFSPALTIQNRKYNHKFQFRDHSSPEKSKEIQFLFNKNNDDCVNHISINSSKDFQMKTQKLSSSMNKIKILILDTEYESNRIFSNQNYQIITQL